MTKQIEKITTSLVLLLIAAATFMILLTFSSCSRLSEPVFAKSVTTIQVLSATNGATCYVIWLDDNKVAGANCNEKKN